MKNIKHQYKGRYPNIDMSSTNVRKVWSVIRVKIISLLKPRSNTLYIPIKIVLSILMRCWYHLKGKKLVNNLINNIINYWKGPNNACLIRYFVNSMLCQLNYKQTCGKSITVIFSLSLIMMLNSLKSPCISPICASLTMSCISFVYTWYYFIIWLMILIVEGLFEYRNFLSMRMVLTWLHWINFTEALWLIIIKSSIITSHLRDKLLDNLPWQG